ncbi:MAG: amidohydrolase family protein [Gemmatimonadota bacterium]
MARVPRIRLENSRGERVCLQNTSILPADTPADITLDLGDAEITTGLINAHDHLHRNHFPRLGRPPYRNAYEWGNDIHRLDADRIANARRLPRRDALLFGALKNLLSGVTLVVHHDAWEFDFHDDFPIRVARVPHAHSLGLEYDRVVGSSEGSPLWLHLAEGTDSISAYEIHELAETGRLDSQLVAVHVVGADARGIKLLHAARAAVVWCPSSNLYLYGQTAPAALLAGDIDLMVGSDALVSADGTLLDELRLARSLCVLDDARLIAAVTDVPARRLNVTRVLTPDAPADLVAFRRPVLEAGVADVALVMIDGEPRVADLEFADGFAACGIRAQTIGCGETRKLVAEPLAQAWQRAIETGAEPERIFGAARVVHGEA